MRFKVKYLFVNYLFVSNLAVFESVNPGVYNSNDSSIISEFPNVKQIVNVSDQQTQPSLEELMFFQVFHAEGDWGDENDTKTKMYADEGTRGQRKNKEIDSKVKKYEDTQNKPKEYDDKETKPKEYKDKESKPKEYEDKGGEQEKDEDKRFKLEKYEGDGDKIIIHDDSESVRNFHITNIRNSAQNEIFIPVSRFKNKATRFEIIQNPQQTVNNYHGEEDNNGWSENPFEIITPQSNRNNIRFYSDSTLIPLPNNYNSQIHTENIAQLNPQFDATVAEFFPSQPTVMDENFNSFYFNGHGGPQVVDPNQVVFEMPPLPPEHNQKLDDNHYLKMAPQMELNPKPDDIHYLKELEKKSEKEVEKQANDKIQLDEFNDTNVKLKVEVENNALLSSPPKPRSGKYTPSFHDAGVMLNGIPDIISDHHKTNKKDLDTAAGEKHEEHKEKGHKHEHWGKEKKHWDEKHKKEDHHHKGEKHKEHHWHKGEHKDHHHKKKGHHEHHHDKHKHEHKHKHKGHKEHWHHDKGGGWEKHWHWDKAEGKKEHWDEHEHKKKHHEKKHGEEEHHHEGKKHHHHHDWGHHGHKHKHDDAHWKDHGHHHGHHHHHHHKEHKHHHHHHHHKHHKDDKKDHWHR